MAYINKMLAFTGLIMIILLPLESNSLFGEYKNAVKKKNPAGMEKLSRSNHKGSTNYKQTTSKLTKNPKTFSDILNQLNSLKKDIFESTKEFYSRRNRLLELLESNESECMERGDKCYSAGRAIMKTYDADKEVMYVNVVWNDSKNKIFTKTKNLYFSIKKGEAKKLFGDKKEHFFHVKLKYVDNTIAIKKILLYDKYILNAKKKNKTVILKVSNRNENSVGDFLHEYIDSGNKRFNLKRRVERFFSEIVRPYYNMTSATLEQIIEDKSEYINKWSERHYKLVNYSINSLYELNEKKYIEATMEIDWRVYSSRFGERGGLATSSVTLVEYGNSYKITGIRSLGIHRNKTNKSGNYSQESTRMARVIRIPWNDTLAIRTGPGVRYRRIGDIPPKARSVRIYKCPGTWCKIQYNGIVGWSHGRYLKSY